LDSGASGNFGARSAEKYCTEVQDPLFPNPVQVANGEDMEAAKQVQFNLAPELSPEAQSGHTYNDLKTGTLVSVGQLADDNCNTIFSKHAAYVFKNGKIIITGKRNLTNGLWNIPLNPTSTQKPPTPTNNLALGVIQNSQTKRDLAGYFHACMFSLTPSTFLRAITKGHFTSWPGLTISLIYKHLTKSIATSVGHLRMQQRNYQSTKTSVKPLQDNLDISPPQEKDNPLTNTMYANFVSTHTIHKTYSDQTGKFIIQSSRGNNYVFILYDYDSNSILSIPLKNRQAKSIADAWKLCYIHLKNNGHAPDLHILDNECSDLLKAAFHKYNIDLQRVPPHSHRRNAAERAIQTWKNHFLSGLATCVPDYPATEWDRLMPQ
jgi:hypothetical protein